MSTIGVGAEYFSLAYDALFGPPFSQSTIRELLLTISVNLGCQNHEMFYTSSLFQLLHCFVKKVNLPPNCG